MKSLIQMNLETDHMKILTLYGTIQIEMVRSSPFSLCVYLFDTSTKKIVRENFRIYNSTLNENVFKIPNTHSFSLDGTNDYCFYYYDLLVTTLIAQPIWEITTNSWTIQMNVMKQSSQLIPLEGTIQIKLIRYSSSILHMYFFDTEKESIVTIPESFMVYNDTRGEEIEKMVGTECIPLSWVDHYSFFLNEERIIRIHNQNRIEITHHI